jgi:hypothetical protein
MHEVAHEFDESILATHLEQVLVELEACVVVLVLLPLQEILLFGLDASVTETFGVVAGKDDLHGSEEPLVELFLLVGERLANPVGNGTVTVLQLNHSDGDTVDINDEIRSTLERTTQCDFFGKSSKSFVDVGVEYQDIPKLDIPLKKVSPTSLLEDGDVVFVDASEDDEGTSRHVVNIAVMQIAMAFGRELFTRRRITATEVK